jgi:hypothetical protein
MNPVDVLHSQIISVATERGLQVEDEPEVLTRTTIPLQLAPMDADPSPTGIVRAVRIDCHHVFIGDLGADSAERAVHDSIRALHYRAANARMCLSTDQKDDLVLILAGPAGSDRVLSWEAHASRLERDDRICRKLVWLPPVAEAESMLAAREFLARTFLARPWEIELGANPRELDARERLRKALEVRELARPGEIAILEAWFPLLVQFADQDTGAVDATEIIEQLTAAFPMGNGGQ